MERVEINLVAKGYIPPIEKKKIKLSSITVETFHYFDGQVLTGDVGDKKFTAEVFKEGDNWFYWYWEV